ncbi:MAG: GGDEF domain-containing protein [Desulfobacteraceae bacterium]|nr:GGDEF domain-containing protein [Desulfobacteraceae bacterium]
MLYKPEISSPMKKSFFLYLLILVPFVSELLEKCQSWFESPRDWISDILMSLVIGIIIWKVLQNQRKLIQLSESDGLTGLNNKRKFQGDLVSEVLKAQREDTVLTLAFIDIDCFKAVNDQHGHHQGDRMLKETAQWLASSVRKACDTCYRVGGDEFAILMPNKDRSKVSGIKARVDQIEQDINERLRPWGAGLSIGMVTLKNKEAVDHFLKRADGMMYEQKRDSKASVINLKPLVTI